MRQQPEIIGMLIISSTPDLKWFTTNLRNVFELSSRQEPELVGILSIGTTQRTELFQMMYS